MRPQTILSERELIRLHHELVVPIAVHEIIYGHEVLDETARYTLDVMITEFAPDTALLCIALCAAHIAQMHATYLPIAGTLGFEASRIVHEYGPLWLANADRKLGPADEGAVLDLLEQMPEEFEALNDLIAALRGHLIDTTDSAILSDILCENACTFMDYLEMQAKEMTLGEDRQKLAHKANEHGEGNVIAFPILSTKSH